MEPVVFELVSLPLPVVENPDTFTSLRERLAPLREVKMNDKKWEEYGRRLAEGLERKIIFGE